MKTIKKQVMKQFISDAIVCIVIALLVLIISTSCTYAQSVGINNPSPHSKSLLDLTSVDKGLLTPRLTQAQRLAMFPVADATAKGMLVYQTDNTQGFYYYDGLNWLMISNGNTGWGLAGNAGTNANTNFIGTTDSNAVLIKSNNNTMTSFYPNNKIGIGATLPFANPTARIEIADEDGLNSDFSLRVASTGFPDLTYVKSRGTLNVPAATLANDVNGAISNWAYDGTKYMLSSRITFAIDSNAAANDVAGSIKFYTANNNLTPEAMRICSNGYVGISNSNPKQKLDVKGSVNIMLDSSYRINNYRVLSTKGQTGLYVGYEAGISNTTGYQNVFAGTLAGYTNTTGRDNTFIGAFSGLYNTTGILNTFTGSLSGNENTTGQANTFYGAQAGSNNQTGSNNTYVGRWAGAADSVNSYSTCIGTSAGFKNVVGYATFVGCNAGVNNTTGTQNTFIGLNSGYSNVTGANNTYLGYYSGFNSTGGNNTFIGNNAGIGNTTGGNNTFIGQMARGGATISNSGAFGYNAYAAISNAIVLGDTGVNIGINNSSPYYPLSFRNNLGNKISFWENAGTLYGIGIQPYLMQIYTANSNCDFGFGTGSSNSFVEKMRIKGNGKVGIGTNVPGNLFSTSILELADSTGVNKDLILHSTNNSNYQQVIAFTRTRGTYSQPTVVQNSDNLGRLSGVGYDGNVLLTASEIQYHVDSIPGSNSMPGNITFHTNDGHSVSYCAERMRIDRLGNVGIGTNNLNARLTILTDKTEAISGTTTNGSYDAISGHANGSGFATSGVRGSNIGGGYGVYGISTLASVGLSVGVKGESTNSVGVGIEAFASSNSGINYAIKATTNSATGYSGYFTGGQFYVNGKAGFGTIAPQTQVEINGAVAYTEDATLIANAATFNVTVGNRTYFRISSNATPASRIIALSNGLRTGQMLIIESTATGGVNGIRLADTPATYNTNLATFHDMYENDVITLIWNGTDWIEVSYANN